MYFDLKKAIIKCEYIKITIEVKGKKTEKILREPKIVNGVLKGTPLKLVNGKYYYDGLMRIGYMIDHIKAFKIIKIQAYDIHNTSVSGF